MVRDILIVRKYCQDVCDLLDNNNENGEIAG